MCLLRSKFWALRLDYSMCLIVLNRSLVLLSRLPILLTFSIVYSALKFLREVIQYVDAVSAANDESMKLPMKMNVWSQAAVWPQRLFSGFTPTTTTLLNALSCSICSTYSDSRVLWPPLVLWPLRLPAFISPLIFIKTSKCLQACVICIWLKFRDNSSIQYVPIALYTLYVAILLFSAIL
jgi:hypothetical protein